MASMISSFLPPLMIHGRKSHHGNMQSFSLSSPLSERQNHVSFIVKATGENSESSTSLTVFKTIQNVWDKPEDLVGLIGLGFSAIVAVRASSNLITAIDKLPIIPTALELVGIVFSLWFTYRYLLFKPGREELFQILNKSVSDILGQ